MTSKVADPSASLARRCISRLLGVHVEHWDLPPRQGAYDLRYERRGRTTAVEVKLLVDADYRAAESEAMKTGYVRCRQLTQSWRVDLKHTASWKEARGVVPDILAQLEDLRWPGCGEFWRLRTVAAGLLDQIEDVGLGSAWPTEPSSLHPPGFYLMPAGWGGGVPGVDAIPAFCDEHLRSPKMTRLRRQLARAKTDERHAFFVVGWEYLIAGALMDESSEIPGTPPSLVDGIDGVWITAMTTGSRVLAWLPDEGWRQADAPPLDASE